MKNAERVKACRERKRKIRVSAVNVENRSKIKKLSNEHLRLDKEYIVTRIL